MQFPNCGKAAVLHKYRKTKTRKARFVRLFAYRDISVQARKCAIAHDGQKIGSAIKRVFRGALKILGSTVFKSCNHIIDHLFNRKDGRRGRVPAIKQNVTSIRGRTFYIP